MSTQKKSLFNALHSLADEYRREEKSAGDRIAAVTKKADGPTPSDPGSAHPSASVDNGCQTVSTGAHAAENSADIKEQQGPASVESTPEAKPGDDKDRSLNLGMQASLVGDDPKTEDNYKATKDDPGTSSPAKVDDGQKYASCSFKEAASKAAELGNQILADLFNGFDATKTAAAPAAPAAAAAPAAPQAMAQGYELAGLFGLSKEAAEAHVTEAAEATIRDALLEAQLVGDYLKAASDEAAEGEDHSSPGGAPEDGGSGAGEGEGSGDESRSSGGEGGAPAGGPTGGAPADPMASLGALGGGGAPPDAGGGMNQEQALQELVMAMQELGITPEMLEQAAAGAGGGGGMPPGGGADPGMGGGDPLAMGAAGAPAGAGGGMPEGVKLANAARKFMRSGKFEFKAAGSKQARELRNQMKRHLVELIS